MSMNDPITALKNVGAARAKLFGRLGIKTVGDLIEFFPRDYEDRSRITKTEELQAETNATVAGIVDSIPESIRIKDIIITKARLRDETGSIGLVWYNQPYMKNNIKKGSRCFFTGKIIRSPSGLQMQVKDYEGFNGKEGMKRSVFLPVYGSTAGLSQKVLRSLINEALKELSELENLIPDDIREKFCLQTRAQAIRNIHCPYVEQAFLIARKTLVFEELFIMQLAMSIMGRDVVKFNGISGEPIGDSSVLISALGLPFSLTAAQKGALEEIIADLQKPEAMSRLLQGDVGCGKTAVAMVAAFIMIKQGFQVAMMAPTEVLAKQHFLYFSQYFEPLGINVVLLTGSLKQKARQEALDRICQGKASMILGTHALISEKTVFHNLGLVITDEQHRFGVKQRELLAEKGRGPHVLVMSATPIPRTLALILYGDMDISTIDSLPPGRQKIDTFCVDHRYRERIYAFIQKKIDEGQQVYVVCALIEGNEEEGGLESVLEYTGRLKSKLKGRIEALHGKMKPEEKQAVMEEFADGNVSVIVSTTVIEVGVNVPNATVMLIENAERFGLSQLHQLRGRVGRGKEKSYCILITDNKGKVCRERMKAMTETQDGFVLSELDLRLRGPGDFFGTQQHGLPQMKLANLYRDVDILKEARKAALDFYKKEKLEDYEALKEKVDSYVKRCYLL